MDCGLESEIWMQAQQLMSEHQFAVMISKACRSYKRLPGHQALERVHFADIGPRGVEALREALTEIGQFHPEDASTFISVRASLRAHIRNVLRWNLLEKPFASGAIVDSQFAYDLGL
jgi:hypothetical protein